MENKQALTQFAELKLMPGQVLQLEFDGLSKTRERSQLLGYLANRSILTTIPTVNGMALPMTVGNGLNVRLFSSRLNGACAFRSTILHSSSHPYPHMHLSLPEVLEIGEVRKTIRVNVKMICSVHYGEVQRVSGILQDLSVGGARMTIKQNCDLKIGEEIIVKCKFEIAEIERFLSVPAIVRSINEDDGIVCGLQFQIEDDMDKISLYAFVLSNLNA